MSNFDGTGRVIGREMGACKKGNDCSLCQRTATPEDKKEKTNTG